LSPYFQTRNDEGKQNPATFGGYIDDYNQYRQMKQPSVLIRVPENKDPKSHKVEKWNHVLGDTDKFDNEYFQDGF
jgi:hypothetical protein